MAILQKHGRLQPIDLSPPEKTHDCSVFTALGRRRTIRDVKADPLPARLLSSLLWAAFGVNRPVARFDTPGRTAASASNAQEIDIYVALETGFYLYDAVPHRLLPILDEDLRPLCVSAGQLGAYEGAGAVLVYVVNLDRFTTARGPKELSLRDPEVQKSYYYVDTGLIAGNIYLFAAAEGLAAWFHNCDREKLAEKLKLSSRHRILFAQSVGFPA
jgi:nitroreductase family protein